MVFFQYKMLFKFMKFGYDDEDTVAGKLKLHSE